MLTTLILEFVFDIINALITKNIDIRILIFYSNSHSSTWSFIYSKLGH